MKKNNHSENHEKAPQCAAFVRAMREAFGHDQVTVLWVKEGDFELGEPYGERGEPR